MAIQFKPENPPRFGLDAPSRVPLVLSAQAHSAPGDEQNLLRQVEAVPITPPECGRLVCLTDEESAVAEAFRLVVVRLRDMRYDRPLKKLLITSTIPQEGKSMVAANLACILAEERQEKVLIVEGDIRRPTLTQTFGIEERAGLCELLRKEVSLSQSIVHLPEAKIWALPAGQVNRNPLDLLQSQKLSPLMAQLEEWFDWIIIDSPPVLPIADTSVWSALADGIVLLARYGITQKKALLRGVKQIDRKKIVGAVLNCSQNLPHSDYYYRRPSAAKRVER